MVFAPKYGNTNVIVYVLICSVLGSFTVMACKGLGVALKETAAGQNELLNPLTWVLVLVVVVCILIQLNYLNKALDIFNTAVVTPIYYVFFTSSVIIASLILYNEWQSMSMTDCVGDLCGFFTIISGIFLLNAFKEMDISWSKLPSSRRTTSSSSSGKTEEDERRLLSTNVNNRTEIRFKDVYNV